MKLKLNSLSSDEALKMLKYRKEGLEKTIKFAPHDNAEPAKLEKFNWYLGNKSFDYGACLYQQQSDRKDIRKQFRSAGEALLKLHELRLKPESNETRNPWLFLKALNIVACFCGPEQRRLARDRKESAYRHPSRPDNQVVQTILVFSKNPFTLEN